MAEKEFDKFIVFKKDELDVVLTNNPLLKDYFKCIETLVQLYRIAHNKKPVNGYVVCNQDEPYAEQVWKIILDGETQNE